MHIVIDNRIRRASSGRYSDRLVEHLQRLDTENTYTVIVEADDPWQPSAGNFTAHPVRYKRFSFNILDQFTYARHLRKLKPDLVHFCMTPQEPIFYSGARITTTHDLTMFKFTRAGRLPGWLHALRMKGYHLLFWSSLRRAIHIITPSQFTAQAVVSRYPFTTNKISVTYEASEPPMSARPDRPSKVGEHFLLHVGSPFPHKNIETLIKAFLLLKPARPDLQLVLAGKKERYFTQLERWASAQKYADDIIFTGFVSDAELKWLYQHAEAYVLPSLGEGFGLPGLEAMAHGCPLISSNATCMPEVYGHAAEFFDPHDPQDIAKHITNVLDSPTRRQELIKSGYARLKKYSWSKMAQETLHIYQSYGKNS